MHLVEKIFAIILMGDGNEHLKTLGPNTFDKSILGLCHSVPKFWERI